MARPALLYFLLWLGVTLSTAMDLEKRIIGGHRCGNNERHYHVKVIAMNRTHLGLCGGSLIRDQWVLTAAHCLEKRGWTVKVIVNVHPGVEAEEMNIADNDIVREPNGHDIMLLKLPKRPKKIHKIDIPNEKDCKNDINVGDKFQVAGLGINAIDANNVFLDQSPKELLCIDNVPVAPCGRAQSLIVFHDPPIPLANAFCAHTTRPPLKDTARGDSGGGTLFRGKIYGVVAGGHPTHAFVVPFYFVRVCKYRVWIERTAGVNRP